VEDLGYFVTRLRKLFPATETHAIELFREDMQSIRSILLGQQLQRAATSTAQADAAAERVDALERQQRVLDCLWFRRIRDRHDTLNPPNSTTFEWVLDDKVNEQQRRWSNVPEWLQGDSDSLYWVCGKGWLA
jgi:hypothetical protein